MSRRRLAVAAVLLSCTRLVCAQQPGEKVFAETIVNWAVAPYWSTPQLVAPQKMEEERTLEAMGAAGVPTPPLPLTAIAPCRIADTRGNGFTGGYGPPALVAGVPRSFTLVGRCAIPVTAEAVSLNVTVTNTQGPGHIVIYPQGGAQPSVSTLNYVPGETVANAAIVPLGTAGGVTVVAGVSGTDLIIDTNGYFAPQTVVNTVNGLSGNVSLAAGSNVSISPAGNTLTIASTGGGSFWSLSGNSIAPGQFLGTTGDQTLELRVNNDRAFRLVPHPTSPNVVGGRFNSVSAGVFGASIGGGGASLSPNRVTDSYATVGGGQDNQAGDNAGTTSDGAWATVAGGNSNVASGLRSAIGGGYTNAASGDYSTIGGGASNLTTLTYSTVAGGLDNTASGDQAVVAGGSGNVASGDSAIIPGGSNNTAAGDFSFAAGWKASANHQGAFVWADGTNVAIASSASNQFIVRANGGIWLGAAGSPTFSPGVDFLRTSTGARLTTGGVWTNNSDRAAKRDFEKVDAQGLLSRLAGLPISRWSYSAESPSVRHIGPMAQDFAAAFAVGSDDRSISTVDADGVALAAIQALYELVKEKDRRIEDLESRLSRLEESSSR